MKDIIEQLRSIDAENHRGRKLLLAPSVNHGRELLAAFAMRHGGWIGWETATLATLAAKLSVVELARRGRRRATDVAIASAVNVAFQRAIARSEVAPELAALAWNAGTRRAVADAILELRVAGVSAGDLEAVGGLGLVPSLAAILRHYVKVLDERSHADAGELFTAALAAFDEQAPFVLDHAAIVAVPSWAAKGLPHRLFLKVVGRGMLLLPGAEFRPQFGVVAKDDGGDLDGAVLENAANPSQALPDIRSASATTAMFYAGSAADELRSVIRQTIAAGRSLDEVEIAATDKDSYGVALESLSGQLGVTYTSFDGVPISATRIGRAVERWLEWMESGLQSDVLRRALDSGDLSLSQETDTAALAREIRATKMGWGVDATRRAINELRSPVRRARIKPRDDENEEEFAKRLAERLATMDELAEFLERLLELTPHIDGTISSAELASRALALLGFVFTKGRAESATRDRLAERLRQIVEVTDEPAPVPYAIAALRQELSELRAWTDNSATTKPRRATGGNLHLTSIENAGTTGRPLRFIVGLDAARTAGAVIQSPLLPDFVRARLNANGADLLTTDDRRRERARELQNAIALPVERLTLSYSALAGSDGREVGPAPAMLDAARAWTGNTQLNYRDLHALLGAPKGAVSVSSNDERRNGRAVPISPKHTEGVSVGDASAQFSATHEVPLDARDVWLGAMNDGALLFDATAQLRESHAMLDRGLTAQSARELAEAGEYHGLVPAAGALDPRTSSTSISPSSLERIAACGLRWFYSVALNARAPDEPTFDALVWLNPLERGSALHRIYELLIGSRVHEEPQSAARNARVAQIVASVAREFAAEVPPPSESIHARELAALEDEALLFVAAEHAAFLRDPWETVALESQFGGRDLPASLPLDDGTSLQLQGRVDRVDKLSDGTLRLVDYKTGRAFELDKKRGAFDGGRKLQLALYSPAISAQFDAVVSHAEYRFTTQKGDGSVARADEALMAEAPRLVRSLLDDVAAGRFLPTIDKSDCTFCDYATVCRVTTGRFDSQSPRADWAKLNADRNSAYQNVMARRGAGEDE